jgi:hypothetical protein
LTGPVMLVISASLFRTGSESESAKSHKAPSAAACDRSYRVYRNRFAYLANALAFPVHSQIRWVGEP